MQEKERPAATDRTRRECFEIPNAADRRHATF
jgi:hypothetical protein